MADTYQITSDQGPIHISPIGELNPLSSLPLTPDWRSTDPDNPKTIFSWSNAYIFTWKLGSYYYMKFQDRNQQLTTTEYNNTGSGYAYVFAYTVGNNPNDANYFRVDAIWETDAEAALNAIQATPQSGHVHPLFHSTWDTAQQLGLIDVAPSWDESPSTDPQNPGNMFPQGGEYAEREDFGQSTDIDLSDQDVPEVSCSKFLTAYVLESNDIANLGSAIFSTNTWTNLQNKFNGVGNPIDYIVSAVEVPWTGVQLASKNFNLGGVDVVNNSGNPVPIPYITQRYYKFNCGTVTLLETWGTEKDYSNTEVSIYLPYVGVKDLDPSVVINSEITVKGAIDLWSGDIFYALHVSNANRKNKYFVSSGITYRFQGTAGKSIPIGHVDNTAQIMATFGAVASMGAGLAMGNPMMALGGAAGLIGASAMGQKVSVANGVSGAAGRADVNYPYLIIRRSVPVYPADWRAHFGAPRYQTFRLGDLTGYVKVADVHAEDIPGANEAERAALEAALKAGVFV